MKRLPRFARNDVLFRGFTLIELLIVMTIIVIMAVLLSSIFNSIGIYNKARDAQRKKDLDRMKVAFEEYYNDTGCYPKSALVTQLNSTASCASNVFAPWMSNWPCDPKKSPYTVIVDDPTYSGDCSKWYKILTNLENKKDASIPWGWYTLSSYFVANNITSEMVNYGVSSPNISWYEKWVDPLCANGGQGCLVRSLDGNFNSAGTGCVSNAYNICVFGWPSDTCQVACCGVGCN